MTLHLSSGTGTIPSLDREWLSDDELPPKREPPPQRENPPPSLSTPPMPKAPEGENKDIFQESANVPNSQGEVPPEPAPPDPAPPEELPEPTSRYWDAPLPDKRRSKPNTKYVNVAQQISHRKVKIGSLNESILMALDWTKNQVMQTTSNCSRMMALRISATTNGIPAKVTFDEDTLDPNNLQH
ncbi:hypothetical protein IV203_018364 [Nitzschia inconspicua]|uniref:Uncharacterized protein n=1 Tax=Nitzschia inconspicua TaxID=303405 RepID=A0A9K3Q6B2_9STRA|nr:hypothetical protein IV203_018364 [Nitzschia inconspicua]